MVKILVCGARGQLGSSLKDLESEYPQFNFVFTDVEELGYFGYVGFESICKNISP